jgi:S-methylmethionine-dependent homocysteine/selenocysteine methylase
MGELTLIDGGMGQELLRRSANPPSPLWSTQVMMDEADVVEAVHRDYIDAGAEYITLNAYSATPGRLAKYADEELFPHLQAQAIAIAEAAREGTDAKIAGCLPPLLGSYQPASAPDYDTSLATFGQIVELQREAVDVFLAETLASVTEVRAATTAAVASGVPVWCAMTVDESDGTKLRSGEALLAGAQAAIDAGAEAVLVNCSPPEQVTVALRELTSLPIRTGAYANGFVTVENLHNATSVDVLEARTDLDPATYADFAARWIDAGATIIGGCCEVGPAHIAELKRRFF